MASSLLDEPGSIYRRFTAKEAEVLRGFVDDVRRLGAMRFFKEVPQSAAQLFDAEGMTGMMEEPDDEAVRAAITQFRQIYNHKEPHSFDRAMKVLKRSVHDLDGPDTKAALALLDGHLEAAREAVKSGVGIGIEFETPEGEERISNREIIDAYFHGHYLHSGNAKSELAKRLDALQPWPKYTLYTIMLRLHNVYWQAANAAERPLGCPALVPGGG